MIPYLQNISSIKKPLETEAANAILEIKNKPNNKDKKNSKNSGHENNNYLDQPNNEDNIFSINSLIYFLEDFLENRLSSKLNDDPPQKTSSFKPWVKTEHSNMNSKPNTASKKAAIAYAHGAEAIQTTLNNPMKEKKNNEALIDIYHLLRDLRDLRNDGINKIKLDKDGTFIDSIYKAVQMAKIEVSNQ